MQASKDSRKIYLDTDTLQGPSAPPIIPATEVFVVFIYYIYNLGFLYEENDRF